MTIMIGKTIARRHAVRLRAQPPVEPVVGTELCDQGLYACNRRCIRRAMRDSHRERCPHAAQPQPRQARGARR